MTTDPSEARLVTFTDRGAPYRGSWVIQRSNISSAGFHACHQLVDQGQAKATHMIEERQFTSVAEARRFSTHLMLHGWSPVCIHTQQGYGLVGV